MHHDRATLRALKYPSFTCSYPYFTIPDALFDVVDSCERRTVSVLVYCDVHVIKRRTSGKHVAEIRHAMNIKILKEERLQ